jgi:hypothetical protein
MILNSLNATETYSGEEHLSCGRSENTVSRISNPFIAS